ncbi:MAG TPA: acyl-CoA dehydrogenase [Acidimicrobiaceae bacterium]|nr:acyl-CoA dehydrogenase [Acidimicrobiaceae bacterium]
MPSVLLTPQRRELVERVAALGPAIAERSPRYDRDASFPHENWADLADAGFLGLCVPVDAGGLGADFAGYALVSEELGRHCAATALTFNMHTATALLAGQISDLLDPDAEMQAHLDRVRPQLWHGMAVDRLIHSQPFSEGKPVGERRTFSTVAVPVDDGYLVSGRKMFASLAGAADVHNVIALVDGDPRLRLLGVPAHGDGVEVVGDWDPLGMRATDSRTLELTEAFVPADHEILPPGMFDRMIQRFPFFYMSLTFTYLGLMRAVLDATRQYLRGESGAPAGRDHPVKQAGWAQMQVMFDRAQAMTHRSVDEAVPDPTPAQLRRAQTATVVTMDGAVEMASLAIRVCGGRSMLRPSRLEQHYRDARCGATMLPWSVEECLARLGRAGLYDEDPPAA